VILMRRMLVFFVTIAVVVAVDQLSKYWIMQHFSLFAVYPVIPGFFNLTLLTNNGAAFGLLAGHPAAWRQAFFIGVNCVALVILWLAQRSYGRLSTLCAFSLGLIGGGAIGNLIDRIRFGFVIDFLDVYVGTYHWPAFNLADSAITVGVLLFLLTTFFADRFRKDQAS
jgi:signal peptidase II